MEKAARRKVLDEHRTADGLLDEVPAVPRGQRLAAGPVCFQPSLSPAPECRRPPMPSSPAALPFPTHRTSDGHPVVTEDGYKPVLALPTMFGVRKPLPMLTRLPQGLLVIPSVGHTTDAQPSTLVCRETEMGR